MHFGSSRAERDAEADWLPLYGVALLAGTLAPFWLHCAAQPWELDAALADIALNLLLFAPLGMATRRLPLLAALLIGVALSLGIELAQLWLPRRPSPWDVIANGAGALLGRALATSWPTLSRLEPLRRSLPLAVAALVATLGLAFWPRALPPNDFSSWQPFPLLLGDEAGGGRPWRGTLLELAIFDRALERDAWETDALPRGDAGEATPWAEGGPVLWLRFEGAPRARLDGPEGARVVALPRLPTQGVALTPRGLRFDGAGWRLPDAWAAHVYQRARARDRLSVALRLRPAPIPSAIGPARIATLSRGLGRRDFTLAQQGDRLVFRLRTPVTGPNGNEPEAVGFAAELAAGREQRATASFDGSASRIWLDGRCAGDRWLALARAPEPFGALLGLALAGCVALGALALRGLALGARREALRRAAPLCGLAGGAAVWAALALAGCWSHLPGFAPWAAGVAAGAAGASLVLRLGR